MNEQKCPKVAIAITTFYKDPLGKDAVRFACAKKQVERGVAAGYTIVVIDDSPEVTTSQSALVVSSEPLVANVLKKLGAKVFRQQQPGMGAAKRESAFHASFFGDIIVMNEAEKYDLVRHIPTLIKPIIEDGDSIVVAKRTAASDRTYPTFQIETEKVADDAFGEIFKKHDHLKGVRPMFGPVVVRRDLVYYFALYRHANIPGLPDTYIQHYGTVLADDSEIVCGVRSVAIDFHYPPEQRAEEDAADNKTIRAKRIEQRDTLIKAYRTLADYLEDKN